MTDPSGYRVRLRVWLAKSLNAQDLSRIVNLAGRVVTIVSQEGGQQLADANWIVLQARGFASEEEANHFGTQLRTITELAGVCCRLGVNVGHGRPPLWMNEEFARSMGLIQPHERLHPNVHGLAILPDDDLTRFPLVHIEATVRADPAQFEGALTELAAGQWVQLSAAAEGVRLLNLALLNPQPLAQAVLAISAVEALGQDQEWTDAQTALLAQLAAQVEAGTSGQGDERMEIADALRRELCRKIGDGVNQAADLISATASIPSLNFIPLTTFGNWF
jgi:hypothetical protein